VDADITICIPAYCSEPFIHSTLCSVLAQTFSNIRVEIAIEPPAQAILDACGALLNDKRVSVVTNPAILGWAGNIKNLLQRVTTRYFMIHYHDDLMASNYVETLHHELAKNPDASIAYTDMRCFGHLSFYFALNLFERPLFDRLVSFFLAGMEAVPVRGLARSSILQNFSFPTDQYDGFAAECEWTMNLLIMGPAIHVPRTLNLKRTFGPDEVPASRKRLLGRSRDQLFMGLEHHRKQMLGFVRRTKLPDEEKAVVELAAEAAILRRHMTFNMGELFPLQLGRSQRIAGSAPVLRSHYKPIQAMNLLVLSQNALIKGDRKQAMSLALEAACYGPDQWEGLAHLSRLQLDEYLHKEALENALRAWAAAPDANGLMQLIADCEADSEERKFFEMMRNGQSSLLVHRFDAERYAIDHPDVASAGMDPWQHYVNFGFREGRKVHVLPARE
jgi:Glycosyl transferase family 2